MLLFHGISFSKLKSFIDIDDNFFTNIWINIVTKKPFLNCQYINCIRIENEFHSTSKTGIF